MSCLLGPGRFLVENTNPPSLHLDRSHQTLKGNSPCTPNRKFAIINKSGAEGAEKNRQADSLRDTPLNKQAYRAAYVISLDAEIKQWITPPLTEPERGQWIAQLQQVQGSKSLRTKLTERHTGITEAVGKAPYPLIFCPCISSTHQPCMLLVWQIPALYPTCWVHEIQTPAGGSKISLHVP
jgi:hypothetical protein